MPKEIHVVFSDEGLLSLAGFIRKGVREAAEQLQVAQSEEEIIRRYMVYNPDNGQAMLQINLEVQAQRHAEFANIMALYRALVGGANAEFLKRMLDELDR